MSDSLLAESVEPFDNAITLLCHSLQVEIYIHIYSYMYICIYIHIICMNVYSMHI